MEADSLYESYIKCLTEIVKQVGNAEASQERIAQEERSRVSEIDNNYLRFSQELIDALNTVRAQYQNVRESCAQIAGLKKPGDQRPGKTGLSWQDAVREQEKAASKIESWIQQVKKEAIVKRQKKVREEERAKAAFAATQAEAARREAEAAARKKKEEAKALIEAMKQKYRSKK